MVCLLMGDSVWPKPSQSFDKEFIISPLLAKMNKTCLILLILICLFAALLIVAATVATNLRFFSAIPLPATNAGDCVLPTTNPTKGSQVSLQDFMEARFEHQRLHMIQKSLSGRTTTPITVHVEDVSEDSKDSKDSKENKHGSMITNWKEWEAGVHGDHSRALEKHPGVDPASTVPPSDEASSQVVDVTIPSPTYGNGKEINTPR